MVHGHRTSDPIYGGVGPHPGDLLSCSFQVISLFQCSIKTCEQLKNEWNTAAHQPTMAVEESSIVKVGSKGADSFLMAVVEVCLCQLPHSAGEY